MALLLRFHSPPSTTSTKSGDELRRGYVRWRSCASDKRISKTSRSKISAQKSKAFSLTNYLSCSKDHKPPMAGLEKVTFDLQKMATCRFGQASVLSVMILFLPDGALAETCEDSFFNMPLLFAIAMIGATVGGLLARQRRGELKRVNDQLRQINAALRKQAKIESYAPTLSYAPVGVKMADSDVIVDPQKEQLISYLRAGKNYLRNQQPEKALAEFKAGLEIARNLEDHVEEKKAARGLGASLQRQGKYKEAIRYHSMVMDISGRTGEDSGVTEAYGAIADCYTELGELEQAGKFYDKYIARLESD